MLIINNHHIICYFSRKFYASTPYCLSSKKNINLAFCKKENFSHWCLNINADWGCRVEQMLKINILKC